MKRKEVLQFFDTDKIDTILYKLLESIYYPECCSSEFKNIVTDINRKLVGD